MYQKKGRFLMRIQVDENTDRKKYVPVPVGNGDLSAMIDFQGAQFQKKYAFDVVPGIRRAGYRYDSSTRPLIPFGYFTQELYGTGDVIRWSQILDTDRAVTETRCEYENGVIVESEVFCHLEMNVIAIRKRIIGDTQFTFRYIFGKPRRIQTSSSSEEMAIHYDADEQEHYRGTVRLLSSLPLENTALPEELSMTGRFREAVFFLVFEQEAEDVVRTSGWDGLFNSHCAAWKKYWDESRIDFPSERLMKTYSTAQYHLRISATKWSIPTGLFDTHWHGRYFAFDELYIISGLLSSGHLDIARRIPSFRHSILPSAISRASSKGKYAAKFPWETVETGEEAAPPGWWQDHIFHMGHVALCAAWYCRYSKDRDFLSQKAYPLMRSCAEFFRLGAIYPAAAGNMTIGICTDFEKLGSLQRNPFATSCSAVATLRASAAAAEILCVDTNLAREWLTIAEKLVRTLPSDGKKYLPYPGCDERSISIFSGVFPYGVFGFDNPLQANAISDALSHESEYANMYSNGTIISTWYAGIKALCYIQSGKYDQALECLEKAAENTGCFSEIFEVFETNSRPWFTTGEGVFIHAVNQLLLYGDTEKMEFRSIHFKLLNDCGVSTER